MTRNVRRVQYLRAKHSDPYLLYKKSSIFPARILLTGVDLLFKL